MAQKLKEDTVGRKSNREKKFNKLLGFFNLTKDKQQQRFVPAERELDKQGKPTGEIKPINMPTSVAKSYEYFTGNGDISMYQSNLFRMERYKDCKYMITVEPTMNTAVQIYVAESFSVEEGKKPIVITAKDKKVEKLFYEWLDSAGFTENFVRECIYNLVVYGDAFWANNIDIDGNLGVKEVSAIDPFLIANRIEFNVNLVNQQKQWTNSMLNLANNYKALDNIYQQVTNKEDMEDFSQFFKSYLFGYELKLDVMGEEGETKAVPSWSITHCRVFTTEQDFAPFGKPMFLNALANFKSYKTTQMLIDMARVSSFPQNIVNIKGGENMDTFTRFQRVDEVRRFIENITPVTNAQDGLAVGERYYAMEDLFTFEVLDNDLDLDKLGDLEYKRTDLIQSTGIPDSYLNPSEGAGSLGGDNSEALKYLCKIFQRRTEGVKSAFLEGLTECFRMHLMLTNTSDGDKTEFEISLPVNSEELSEDKLGKDSELLSFASDILSNVAECCGLERGESLPQDVIIDVLKTYLPVENFKVDKWVKAIFKSAEEQDLEKENLENGAEPKQPETLPFISNRNTGSSTTERIKETLNNKPNLLNEAYLKTKKERGILDGKFGNMYTYNNSYRLENSKYEGSSLGLLKEELNQRRVEKIRLQEKNN